MAHRPANWSLGEGYNAVFMPTKADGTPGVIQAGSGKWSSTDAEVVFTAMDDLHARIDATANVSATIVYEADGDLGTGVFPIRVEAMALFNDTDVAATGGTLELGEPASRQVSVR
jgi:hypothetical protein